MNSLDTEVLQLALAWLREGHAVHLATVVQTWGSAPRQAGAMLAVRKDGRWYFAKRVYAVLDRQVTE